MERIRKIENIYSKLEDDISRNIFQARLQYVFDNENYQKKIIYAIACGIIL